MIVPQEGQILIGPSFNEPVRMETVRRDGDGTWTLGVVGTSLDLQSGELRLIEVKGIGGPSGSIFLTPNEHRVAEDRRDCYWLYVVTNCNAAPRLTTVKDPATQPWQAVQKVEHYTLNSSMLRGEGRRE